MKLLTAFGLAALIAGVLGAAACGGNSPTAPPLNPPTATEHFTGSLDSGGSNNHTFGVSLPGEIDITVDAETAVINGVTTPVTITLAMDLGVWNGTSCSAAYNFAAVKTGYTTAAQAAKAGTFCIRMYDTGNVTSGTPVTYSVTVAHP